MTKASTGMILALVFGLGACGGTETVVNLPGSKVIVFKHPISIEDLAFYKDGGTTAFTIKGRTGQLRFSSLALYRQANEKTQGNEIRSCIGADFPNKPGATTLPRNGKEEKSVLALLHVWADSQASREKQSALQTGGTVLGLSEDAIRLFRILAVIHRLEQP